MVCIFYFRCCVPLPFHSFLSLFDLGLLEQGSHFMLNRCTTGQWSQGYSYRLLQINIQIVYLFFIASILFILRGEIAGQYCKLYLLNDFSLRVM